MTNWRVEEGPNGLRLVQVVRRALGSVELTWADLLSSRLRSVDVYALYFPSRFDLRPDTEARSALEVFATQTGPGTLVSFWDPTDPEFSRALTFFDLKTPPALVLSKGLAPKGKRRPDKSHLYAIAITDPAVLVDREQLASAVNGAHEVLVRGDPKEIAGYLRERAVTSLLATIGSIASGLRDQLLRVKPKFLLPGGAAIQLG